MKNSRSEMPSRAATLFACESNSSGSSTVVLICHNYDTSQWAACKGKRYQGVVRRLWQRIATLLFIG